VRYRINVEGQTFEIDVKRNGQVWVNAQSIEVDLKHIHGLQLYSLLVDHRSFEAHVDPGGDEEQQVLIAGRPYKACLQGIQQPSTENTAWVQAKGSKEITAPLPGWLSEIRVSDGQLVKVGDVVAVMESMKMSLELRAPHAGVVHLVNSNVCREVTQGEILAVINHVHDQDI